MKDASGPPPIDGVRVPGAAAAEAVLVPPSGHVAGIYACTMSSDPVWKYVSVRRLTIFVEESIDEGTQWVQFEPNEEATWVRPKTRSSSSGAIARR